MVSRRCAAKTCFNTPATRPSLKFFTFPKVELYARLWAEVCSRPDLINKSMEMLTRYVLCAEHFEDHCFLNPKHKASFIRTTIPIPTIFRNNFEEHMVRRFGIKISTENAATLGRTVQNPQVESECKGQKEENEIQCGSIPGQGEQSSSLDSETFTISLMKNVHETDEQSIHKFCRLCACLVPADLLTSMYDMHLDTKINKLLPRSLHTFKDDGLPEEVCGPCIGKLMICTDTITEFFNADKKLKALRKIHEKEDDVISSSVKILESEQPSQVYYVKHGENVLSNNGMQFVEVNIGNDFNTNAAEMLQEPLQNIAGECINGQPSIVCNIEQKTNLTDTQEANHDETTLLLNATLTNPDQTFQPHNNTDSVEKSQDTLASSLDKPVEIMLFKCMDCNEEFTSREVLLSHSLILHPRAEGSHEIKYCMVKKKLVKKSKTKRYKCTKCSAEYSGNRAYRAHSRTHLPRCNMCEYCGSYFMLKSQLESHRRLHTNEKPYHCSVCGESFIFRNSFRRHRRSHAEEKPAKECEKCKKTFASLSLLRKHEKIHSEGRGVLCSLCGKVLANAQSLKVHLRTHNEERPFSCASCFKTFRTNSQLNHHNETHRKEKRFDCPQCHKQFHTKGLLRQHMNSHSGTKPYACDICGTSFNRFGNLGQHKKKHDALKGDCEKVLIKCEICNKILSSEFTFKHHMAKHNGEKKPYSCELCEKRFMTVVQWKVHRRLHTGERPFVCSVCSKPFRSDATMKQHHLTFHTDKFPYECPYCERRFKRLQSLNVHKKTHTGERPFPCSICGRAFAQKGDMMKHMKVHNQDSGSQALRKVRNQLYSREDNVEETVIRAINAEHMAVLALGDMNTTNHFLLSIPNVEVQTEFA